MATVSGVLVSLISKIEYVKGPILDPKSKTISPSLTSKNFSYILS